MAEANVERLFDGRKLEELPRTRGVALASGTKHYFTGKPCKRGHVTARFASVKICCGCHALHRKEWVEKYPDKVREVARKGMVKVRAADRAAYNDKQRLINRAWREENLYFSRERCRLWAKDNREKHNAKCQRRRARERGAGGSHTAADVERIFDQQKGKCACCRTKLDMGMRNFHVDHIRALSNGGDNSPSNIQLLCNSCNLSKGARDQIEFMQTRGFLL